MSKKYNLVKKYYDGGFWTKEMVFNATIKGWITEEEYYMIINHKQEETSSVEEIQEEPMDELVENTINEIQNNI